MNAFVLKSFLVSVFACLLAACQASTEIPITGEVKLTLVKVSQSEIQLMLVNATAHAITLRGTYKGRSGADPWDVWPQCARANSEEWIGGPYPLADGGQENVNVDPGSQLDLFVDYEFDEFIQRFKGERCKLSLRLKGGAIIDSDEFVP